MLIELLKIKLNKEIKRRRRGRSGRNRKKKPGTYHTPGTIEVDGAES